MTLWITQSNFRLTMDNFSHRFFVNKLLLLLVTQVSVWPLKYSTVNNGQQLSHNEYMTYTHKYLIYMLSSYMTYFILAGSTIEYLALQITYGRPKNHGWRQTLH